MLGTVGNMGPRRTVINWAVLTRRLSLLGMLGVAGPLDPIIGKYSRLLPVVALLGLIASILEVIGIGLLIPLLALLLTEAAPTGMPAPIREVFELTQGQSAQVRIVAISATMLGLIVFKGLIQAGNASLIGWVNGAIGRDMRTALSSRILSLDYRFFLRHDTTRLVHIISTDSWFVSDALRSTLSIGPAVLGLTVFCVFLVWLDWRLFLIVLAGTVVIRAALKLVERRLRRLSDEVSESNYSLGERMMAIVSAMRIVCVFGQQDREQQRFVQSAERVRRAMFASQRTSATMAPGIDVLTSLLFVMVLVVGYRLGTPIPAIAAFLVVLARAQPHARALSESRMELAARRGSIREVEWLLSQRAAPASLRGSKPVERLDQPIRFDGVSFRYRDVEDIPAVSEVTATIRPGVATALIGRSGSGKTTLVNLLCRLVEPTGGTISHGADALCDLDPDQWRARIAIAGQDIALLDGTLADNIAYGKPDATREEIELAAQVAGASAFIGALPDGYMTHLGLNSISLSGGQRQRIGLARALLTRPDLLILDEAISAVDSISEAEIIKLLSEHRHFRTALVVSHRKSTLSVCQDCIVLEGGRVVEQGPIDQSEYYRTMA